MFSVSNAQFHPFLPTINGNSFRNVRGEKEWRLRIMLDERGAFPFNKTFNYLEENKAKVFLRKIKNKNGNKKTRKLVKPEETRN